MIKNEIPANAEKTEGAYRSQIIELQAEVSKLENRIRELQIRKDEIESENESTLKHRQEKLDLIIAEQQKIKNTIITGATELQEKQEAFDSDKKSHAESVKIHQESVADFQRRKQEYTEGIKRLEEEFKSLIEKNKKKSDELDAREKQLNEKSLEVERLFEKACNLDSANKEEAEIIKALEEELSAQAEALNNDKSAHASKILSHQKSVADFESERQASIARIAKAEEMLTEARRLKAETDDQYLKLLDLRAETNQKVHTLNDITQRHQQTLQQLTNLKEKLILQGGTNVPKVN